MKNSNPPVSDYDFSWILKEVRSWKGLDKENITINLLTSILPFKLIFWYDLDNSFIRTHLGEDVKENYHQQRENYIKWLVKNKGTLL